MNNHMHPSLYVASLQANGATLLVLIVGSTTNFCSFFHSHVCAGARLPFSVREPHRRATATLACGLPRPSAFLPPNLIFARQRTDGRRFFWRKCAAGHWQSSCASAPPLGAVWGYAGFPICMGFPEGNLCCKGMRTSKYAFFVRHDSSIRVST